MADQHLTEQHRHSIKRAYDTAVATERKKARAFEKAGDKLSDAQYELEQARKLKYELETTCEQLGLLDQRLLAVMSRSNTE
jgi:hypothetical protein